MKETFESQSFRDESGLPRNWADGANCKGLDAEIFHPGRGEPTKHAKAVCVGCVAVEACLHYALSNNIKFGVWGGKSERERRAIRKTDKPAL